MVLCWAFLLFGSIVCQAADTQSLPDKLGKSLDCFFAKSDVMLRREQEKQELFHDILRYTKKWEKAQNQELKLQAKIDVMRKELKDAHAQSDVAEVVALRKQRKTLLRALHELEEQSKKIHQRHELLKRGEHADPAEIALYAKAKLIPLTNLLENSKSDIASLECQLKSEKRIYRQKQCAKFSFLALFVINIFYFVC